MAYNKTSEERKWNYWKEQEEKKLRELGMEEEKIQKLRQMDREDFLEERRYREHLDETMQDMDSIKEKDSELFARDVKELLDHIGDKRIYELLKETEHPIHFKKHIQISMEHGHANHLSDDWSCTAYWYQAAPVTSVTIQPVEERIPLKRTFDIPKPAHQVELTPEMQEAYRSRNERMEKFKVEKAEQIRLNAARTAPSETGNKELAHKVKKEFDKEK